MKIKIETSKTSWKYKKKKMKSKVFFAIIVTVFIHFELLYCEKLIKNYYLEQPMSLFIVHKNELFSIYHAARRIIHAKNRFLFCTIIVNFWNLLKGLFIRPDSKGKEEKNCYGIRPNNKETILKYLLWNIFCFWCANFYV